MWFKLIILFLLFVIVFNLFQALYYMVKGEGYSKKFLRSLMYRIALSIGLFVLLVVAMLTGVVEPHTIKSSGNPPGLVIEK